MLPRDSTRRLSIESAVFVTQPRAVGPAPCGAGVRSYPLSLTAERCNERVGISAGPSFH